MCGHIYDIVLISTVSVIYNMQSLRRSCMKSRHQIANESTDDSSTAYNDA